MTNLPAMSMVASPRSTRTLAVILILILVFTALALVSTPWQQSVSGQGDVSALTPLEAHHEPERARRRPRPALACDRRLQGEDR